MLVRKALQRYQGNVSQAAEALGLSRGALPTDGEVWRLASSAEPSLVPPSFGSQNHRSRPRKRVRLLYEHRISLYCFLVALPGLLVSVVLVWMQPWSLESRLCAARPRTVRMVAIRSGASGADHAWPLPDFFPM